MIILTRLGCGIRTAVNPDLIERAEHTPDTIITLVDGHKLVVEEPLDVVIAAIRTWRASIAAEAIVLAKFVKESPGSFDPDSQGLAEDALVSGRAAQASSLGRLIRLPARGV